MKRILYTISLLTAFTTAYAQVGFHRLDINPGAGSSYPLHLTAFDGKAMCYANNGTKGWELYQVQLPLAPVLVQDINPLAGNTIGQYFNRPMAPLNGKLYFTAENGVSGFELFVYNGATLPSIAYDIVPGNGSSSPDDYAVLNNLLYFRAHSAGFGYELWAFDPNTNTPTRLTDINTGADSSVTGNVIAYKNHILFTADSGSGNNELYVYDPLSSNVTLLDDINPGITSSNPQGFIEIGGILYFTADNGTEGRELYSYNGTVVKRETDLVPGSSSGVASYKEPIVAGYNGKIYLNGRDAATSEYHLFSFDPATGNTALVAKTNASGSSEPRWLTPYGGKLYFSAVGAAGYELWSFDGTTASQALDICPGAGSSSPQQLLAIGNDLFFRAVECGGAGSGDDLYRYNYQELGISRASFEGTATIYPNPAKDAATLELKLSKAENLRVTLTDITGRVVFATNAANYAAGTHAVSIPLQQLQAGMYLYNIYNAEGSTYKTGKLVIE